METDALKKALADLLVEVLLEVKSRTADAFEAYLRSFLEKERSLRGDSRPAAVGTSRAAMPRFVSTKQAAAYWGTSTVAFRRTLDRLFPELPKGIVVRLGRRVRVDMEAFEKWLVAMGPSSRL